MAMFDDGIYKRYMSFAEHIIIAIGIVKEYGVKYFIALTGSYSTVISRQQPKSS